MMKVNVLDLTDRLRRRLQDYRKSESYIKHSPLRNDVRNIEIMINLTELACENNVEIKECNYHWFTGSYIIDYDFNGEWEDISDLYSKIVGILEDEKMIII